MAEDEVGESWEDLEDSGELDKQIQKLTPMPRQIEQAPTEDNATILEDTERSSYQPQVRILKRQSKPTQSVQQDTVSRSTTKPSKTLAEREAAYAEARLRILGAASGDNSTEPEKDGPVRLAQQLQGVRMSENVVRQPSGPDGTKGFDKRDKPR